SGWELKRQVQAKQEGAAAGISRVVDARREGRSAAGVHLRVEASVLGEGVQVVERSVKTQRVYLGAGRKSLGQDVSILVCLIQAGQRRDGAAIGLNNAVAVGHNVEQVVKLRIGRIRGKLYLIGVVDVVAQHEVDEDAGVKTFVSELLVQAARHFGVGVANYRHVVGVNLAIAVEVFQLKQARPVGRFAQHTQVIDKRDVGAGRPGAQCASRGRRYVAREVIGREVAIGDVAVRLNEALAVIDQAVVGWDAGLGQHRLRSLPGRQHALVDVGQRPLGGDIQRQEVGLDVLLFAGLLIDFLTQQHAERVLAFGVAIRGRVAAVEGAYINVGDVEARGGAQGQALHDLQRGVGPEVDGAAAVVAVLVVNGHNGVNQAGVICKVRVESRGIGHEATGIGHEQRLVLHGIAQA
nr:hypothetical protein [Tanacetum cinerariifolium]